MSEKIIIKTPEQIEGVRKSCRLAADCLDYITPFVIAGATTESLDDKLEAYMRKHGAIPACKGYKVGNNVYPKATCISLNEVVCHGIPGPRKLRNGDILNIDVTTILDGYYGDTSRMYKIGKVSREADRLISITSHALALGIREVAPGKHFGDIGYAIAMKAKEKRLSVVEVFCAHGVGIDFHEPPLIPHIANKGSGAKMEAGMIFTVEPMLNTLGPDVRIKEDGWTAVTRDGGLSAQWEETILVTPTGFEILTRSLEVRK